MTELLSGRITMDSGICHGKPCIRGLRYPVENILEWLGSGMSVEEIFADYEDLEKEDIMAALDFVSRLVPEQTSAPNSPTNFGNKRKLWRNKAGARIWMS